MNEPCDIDADYSTFDYFRRGEVPPIPDSPDGLPHVTERFVRPHKDCVVHRRRPRGHRAGRGHLERRYRDVDYRAPTFMWCNFTLTDSAFHIGGPHSEIAERVERDAERAHRRGAGRRRTGRRVRSTAFVLVADHGMQQTDPDVLRRLGRRPRARGASASATRGYGLLYLDED